MNLTKEHIEKCIKYIKGHLHFSYDKDIIIDFTSQRGEFIEGSYELVKIPLFYHKEPLIPEVKQIDFFNLDFDKFNKTHLSGLWFDEIHVIGCPPSHAVEECIDIACNFAQSVSFILPNKASKSALVSPYIFPSNYRCIFNVELDSDLIFQIWIKSDF